MVQTTAVLPRPLRQAGPGQISTVSDIHRVLCNIADLAIIENTSTHLNAVHDSASAQLHGVHTPYFAYHSAFSAPYAPIPSLPPRRPLPPLPPHSHHYHAAIPSPTTAYSARPIPSASATHQQPSSGSNDSMNQLVAATFGGKVFEGVPIPSHSVDPTKAHLWYLKATMEARIQVVLNSIKAAGFEPFGQFFVKLLTEKYTSPSVIKTVSRFIESDTGKNTQPVDVIRALYGHRLALSTPAGNGRSASIAYPSLPRHALPPSSRLLARPSGRPATTRQILLDWALSEVLAEIDREADWLLRPVFGLTSRSQAITWSMLCSYSLAEQQELLAQNAPALFAVLTTAATSTEARQKLESQVKARIAAPPPAASVHTSGSSVPTTPAEGENATTPEAPEFVRDAWLVSSVFIFRSN